MEDIEYILDRLKQWRDSTVGQRSHLGHKMLHNDLDEVINIVANLQRELTNEKRGRELYENAYRELYEENQWLAKL